jgi:hypothetical protein
MIRVRKGGRAFLTRDEFRNRFGQSFVDPAFDQAGRRCGKVARGKIARVRP